MSDNPYIKRIEKRGKTGHGRIAEKKSMQSIAARLTPASGALRGAKGDGTMEKKGRKYRGENKATVHNSLSIELGWLNKIYTEALASGAEPFLAFQFVTPEGKARPSGDWVAIPKTLFKELTDE